MKTKILFLFVFFLCAVSACKDKDEVIWTEGESEPEVEEAVWPFVDLSKINLDQDFVNGKVFGHVHDGNDNPIEGATIKLEGQTFSTDKYGNFLTETIELDRQGTFYTVEKDGYFQGSRRFFPQKDVLSYTRVELINANNVGSFDAAAGGTIDGPNGLKITIPENAVVDASGSAYSGTVEVFAEWLDPSSERVGRQMPGDLQGVNRELEEVSLASFSMAAIELRSGAGELNLASGSTAEVRFPIPNTLLGNAPNEITLWSFEEEQYGIWIEEGTAVLEGNEYVGTLHHFSFWNCDAPFPIVYVTGILASAEGVPIPNQTIQVYVEGTNICRSGQTDENGIFAGKMPKDRPLVFAMGECETGGTNFGPFSEDTDMGSITLPSDADTITINGTLLDCDLSPVSFGFVKTEIGGKQREYLVNDDGTFEFAIIHCGPTSSVSITGVDMTNLVQGDPVSFALENTIDAGDVVACGNVVDFYVTESINGGAPTNYIDIWAGFEGGIYASYGNQNDPDGGGYFALGEYDYPTDMFTNIEVLQYFESNAYDNDQASLTLVVSEHDEVARIVAGSISGLTTAGDNYLLEFRLNY